jgi:transcriptional regulator with XRE-family HTH domain
MRLLTQHDPNVPPPPDASYLEGIGSRIVQLRNAKHWSQRRLAQLAGLRPSRLSHLETSKTTPTLGELIVLAEALGGTLDEMVFGRTRPSVTNDLATGFATLISGAPNGEPIWLRVSVQVIPQTKEAEVRG